MKQSPHRIAIAALQLAGLAAALGAAGCASTPEKPYMAKTSLDMHPITVRQDAARLEIAVAPEDAAVRTADLGALSVFLDEYKTRGRGPLVISMPAGAGNSEAAVRVGADLRRVLYDQAVAADGVAGGAYDAAGKPAAPIILSFERYEADAVDCPSYGAKNAARSWDNEPMPSFGCSINANIAAMLVDPGDVVAPQPMDAASAQRRGEVFDKYRKGLPTGAERSADERGTISQAVK
jgi:pilus assembly protein CpaD